MQANGSIRTLFVGPRLVRSGGGGRELLSVLNHDVLEALFGESFSLVELRRAEKAGLAKLRAGLGGHLDGLEPEVVREIVDTVRRRRVERVFIDGSNLGELARVLKRECSSCEVVTFFHNVETRFFLGAWRANTSLHSSGVLLANALAEWKAVRHSDRLVALSHHDAALLQDWFGARDVQVSALAMRDQRTGSFTRSPSVEPHALFVGGLFYANRAGVEWYIEHVAARARLKTRVVGRGFEALRDRLTRPGIEVVGPVESLEASYVDASVVVAPIFDGSGMKTKVAEALMHGKKVIGTPEAFAGYDAVLHRAGWLCTTAEDFVRALEEASMSPLPAFDPEMRRLYDENYSFDAALQRMSQILCSPAPRISNA